MKGTFFNKEIEWNLETTGESWFQGNMLVGTLKVKNHGLDSFELSESGVALSLGEIKKVQSKAEGALKVEQVKKLEDRELKGGSFIEAPFSFQIGPNAPVTDKKISYYLTFGKNFSESQLQVKVSPSALFTKVVSLMDTFYRFKLKDFKTVKNGVEFKFHPSSSREMANIESLHLIFSMEGTNLIMNFNFQLNRLDTSSVTTKINKEIFSIKKELTFKEYSLGADMINQDQVLKALDFILGEVKLKNLF
jgi:hypothetical protein